ncbi:hypothetical protein [Micromonospora rhizosphaerae]|uniref:hypothetical protein n=1 Tax=Micromonospora rhizosphaerae TaxID=568872 RepID=UPI00114CD294|nr:hypothetical protein [Micromonospora rhizosphaerae]
MTATDGTATGWRARWVKRENERRRTAYEAALQEWRRRDDELRRIYARAEEPAEPAEPAAALPLPLDDDEVLVAVQPSAELVEVTARHTAGLPAPELTVVPVEDTGRPPRLPKGVMVVDAGMAVITDRRLILVGRSGIREWPYEWLAGVAHHAKLPLSLLHPHGRGRIQGVAVPHANASAFRLRLTLAYAEAVGEREALLDRLDEAVVAHWHKQPEVPAPATPAEAPAAARLARPVLVAAVAVLVALAATAGAVRWSALDRPVVGMEMDGGVDGDPTDPGEPSPSTGLGTPVSSTPTISPGATGTPVPGRPDPGTTAPTAGPGASGEPNPGRGGPSFSPPQPPDPGDTGNPQPSPSASSPSPIPADRCGAPENPYNYNYCGGSRIYDPEADVCSYFACVETFWEGNGYMVLCNDGLVSMTGMGTQPCGGHGGTKQDVYDA